MRWSKAFLTSGVLALSFNMVACKESKTGATPRVAAAAANKVSEKTENTGADLNRGTSLATAESCYEDLCQPNTEINSKKYYEQGAIATPEITERYEKNMAPLVKEMIKNRLELSIQHSNLLGSRGADMVKAQLSKNQEIIILSLAFLTGGEFLTEEQKTVIASFYGPLREAQNLQLLNTSGAEAYLKLVQNTSDIKAAARNEAKEVFKIQADVNKLIGADALVIVDEGINLIASGESFDPVLLEKLAVKSGSFRLLRALMSGPTEKAAEKLNIRASDYVQLYLKLNPLQQLRNNTSAILNKSEVICRTSYTQAVKLSPTREQIDSFKQKAEIVRNAVINVLDAQDAGREAVKLASISYPLSKDSIDKSWTEELKSDLAWSKNKIKVLPTLDDATLMTYSIITALGGGYKEDNCADITDIIPSDSASHLFSAVKVSPFSIVQPAYGVSILAHELGHIASYKSTNLDSVNSCLEAKQDSKQFISEDYADLIAAKVSLKLQNEFPGQKNMGCFFVDKDVSLRQKKSSDKHSSELYRALQIALVKKESIPDSCKELVKTEAPKALEICE